MREEITKTIEAFFENCSFQGDVLKVSLDKQGRGVISISGNDLAWKSKEYGFVISFPYENKKIFKVAKMCLDSLLEKFWIYLTKDEEGWCLAFRPVKVRRDVVFWDGKAFSLKERRLLG